MLFYQAKNFLKEVVVNFFKDGALEHSAAISFYVILSFPAFLLIAVSIGGLLLEQAEIQRQIITYIQQITELENTQFLENILVQAVDFNTEISTLISSILLIVTASAVLIALQEALNDIWGITEKPDSMIRNFLVDRSVSLIALFILGLLFIANTLLEILFGLGIGLIANYLPFSNTILNSVNFALGILLIFLIFLFIFKFLPDVKISWWDGIVGAVVTTSLFLLGKNIISWYLSSKNLSSAYGAASSVILFLLWVYYSTLILFFGAEVTQVYSNRFGSGISPSENAEFKDSKLQSQSKLRRLVNLINPWHEE